MDRFTDTDRASPLLLTARQRLRWAGAGLSTLLLAGCGGTLGSLTGGEEPRASPTGPTPSPNAVRVGLILPLSGSGATVGQGLRNAAELSVSQFENPNVALIIKDDASSPEGARAAAQQALGEGAEILLGPLFAPAVAAAGQVAKAANRPMIAFSSDSNAASRGVYLLSFLPENEVDRIVSHAVSQGRRAFAALIPEDAYGNVARTAFEQAVSRHGARLVALETFPLDRARIQPAVAKISSVIAGAAPQAEALFVPANAGGLAMVGEQLRAVNFNPQRVKPLGTGTWNEASVYRIPSLQGGGFAAPDPSGFNNFAQRYQQRYNSSPTRISTLAYDATSLVIALVRTQGPRRFSEEILTNASGFSGADGIFRFRQDGTNERALAINEIRNGSAVAISAAPKTFQGGA
ncbi:MAG: penicillin-binding protein activator [Beijerinckiaceae bacterium]